MTATPDPHQIESESDKMVKSMRLGMDIAIGFMREGNLRLAPLPFEVGKRPYDRKLQPFKATALIWRSWWREKRLK